MKRSVIGRAAIALLVIGVSAAGYVWIAGGSAEPSVSLTTPTIASGTTEDSTVPSSSDATRSFVIDDSASEAFFLIDEVLRGTPQTVKGTTSEVAGLLQADLSDLPPFNSPNLSSMRGHSPPTLPFATGLSAAL